MKLFASLLLSMSFLTVACQEKKSTDSLNYSETDSMTKVVKTEEEWREQLSPQVFHVTRESGTERAFTGELTDEFDSGTYYCVCCGAELFESTTKFHSGCGWPSFYDKGKANNIVETIDKSHGMIRTEVKCAQCDAHLGHVFEDGPDPTGLRYCINSAALRFEKK